jgi:hypothetical protein
MVPNQMEFSNMNGTSPTLRDTQRVIAEVCDELKTLLIHKNRQYGDSAINPVRIFSRADNTEQLKVRVDDKLSRIARGDEQIEDEDVLNDLIGYMVLMKVARRKDG